MSTIQLAVLAITLGVVFAQYVLPAIKPLLLVKEAAGLGVTKHPAMRNMEVVMGVRDQYTGRDQAVVDTANQLLELLLKSKA